MQRRTRLAVLATLIVVLAIGAAFTVRWIPAGEQELLLVQGGESRVLGPGPHFVLTGAGQRIRYPVGEWTYAFPAEEGFRALNAGSIETDVELFYRLDVPAGSADAIHRHLGRDLGAAMEAALQRIVVAQAREVPGEPTPAQLESFAGVVREAIGLILEPAGITVVEAELTRWAPLGIDPVDKSLATAEVPRRVVFVGVDGADWTLIDPLIEQGRLPNFARLRSGGATGELESIKPLLSPLLWTTMATGKLPEEHGVLDFNVTDPATGAEVPVNRTHRKVDAIWNMMGDFDRRVGVVGWLATHPPERVEGWMISDRMALIAQGHVAARSLGIGDVVQPPEDAARFAPLVTRHADLEFAEIHPFLSIDQELFRKSRDLEDGADRSVSNFLSLYAAARTSHAIALELLDERLDFLAVYFDFLDASLHLFMPAAPPRRPEISEEEFARFGGAVEAVLVEQDRMLGEIMDRMGDDALLMVASDHGFKNGQARLKGRSETWTGQAPLWHRTQGIVAFWGNGATSGKRIEEASLIDVAPTLLALAGLPRTEDMPGRVLVDAFDPELRDRLPERTTPTLERHRADEARQWTEDPAVSEEITRKLQALGYVSVAPETNHRNLAERYKEQGDFARALEEFRRAMEDEGEDPGLLNNVAVCLDRLGRGAEAERTYRRVLELDPRNVFALNNLAVFYLERRQPERALPWAERAVQIEPGYANAHLTLGSAYGMLGRLEEAAAEFRRVLELDPSDERARANLRRLREATGG